MTDNIEFGIRQQDSVGLCLSGGGYRALLFHTGALWRLNDLGWLAKLDVVSSVSGGAFAAGVLAKAWSGLQFQNGVAVNFENAVVTPIRRLAGHSLDVRTVLLGLINPTLTVGEVLAETMRRSHFGEFMVNELPSTPQFVFNATNLQNGEPWWFYRDKEPPEAEGPPIRLATAVAASSAFPPFLSPILVPTSKAEQADGLPPRVVLSDAGVYDNLGLDPVANRCGTVLVSNAGLRFTVERRVPRDWPRHLLRALDVIDNQVRELRKRSILQSFVDGGCHGAYWACDSDIDHYEVADALPVTKERIAGLAATSTRLHRLPDRTQQALINWGYTITDVAMRRHVVPDALAPEGFPYPAVRI